MEPGTPGPRGVLEDALRAAGCRSDGKGQWSCPVPSHGRERGDRHPSLSVKDGSDGRVLIHCHGGCPTSAILEVLGLSESDLFPRPPWARVQPTRRKLLAKYDYTDEFGEVLYQVVRYEPKSFRQRRPNGKGGWIWDLKGVRRVPYGLPEVFDAIQAEDPIYIVEGERDADRLAGEGLVATCNSGGAGKWADDLSNFFRGAQDVRVVADRDDPGRKHAVAVVESLTKVGVSARLFETPHGKDISEFLALSGDLRDLVELDSKELGSVSVPGIGRTPIVVRMSDVEAEDVEWVWHPYIPLGKVTLLEGDPGVGKTWLALAIAAAVTKGHAFPGSTWEGGIHQRGPANAIYMTCEDGIADTLRPRLDKAGADVDRVFAVDGFTDEEGERQEITLKDLDVLEKAVVRGRPLLVVLDPLQGFVGSDTDTHRANQVRPLMAALARLAEKYALAVLCIRHLAKNLSTSSVRSGLGSIDFAAAARSILLVGEDPNDSDRRILAHSKSNLAKAGVSLSFEVVDGEFRWGGESDVTASELLEASQGRDSTKLERAEEFLRGCLAGGPVPATVVEVQAKEASISRRTLRRAKRSLGIASKRLGIPGRRGGGESYWTEPGQWEEFVQKQHLHGQDSPRAAGGHVNEETQEFRTLANASNAHAGYLNGGGAARCEDRGDHGSGGLPAPGRGGEG